MWLEKQPAQGRWGGLWMFPFWENKKEMTAVLRGLNLRPVFFLKGPHAFTKYRITLEVYESTCKKRKDLKERRGQWISMAKLDRMALPSPHKKIAQALIARAIFQSSLFPERKLRIRKPRARLT